MRAFNGGLTCGAEETLAVPVLPKGTEEEAPQWRPALATQQLHMVAVRTNHRVNGLGLW
eukprot:CAMPEP_0184651800 /NCGR_PEP_ID=MMETSP0308-20130426/9445_1 /TAXON_ID=38269 /ORGANISM="Gloeochaete witrockiana, Strain SAG 46.84" /LENGTH=58 /DNA_ID=CAMNT_0027086261 /DNA_START=146 /DNA_END=322 /DNA_ORIENTATION=-